MFFPWDHVGEMLMFNVNVSKCCCSQSAVTLANLFNRYWPLEVKKGHFEAEAETTLHS